MDYLSLLLVEPIEADDLKEIFKSIQNPFPDSYREYLFNNPHFVFDLDPNRMSKLSQTKLKYWNTDYNFVDKFTKLIRQLKNHRDEHITYLFTKEKEISPDAIRIYNKFYDLADIVISRRKSNRMFIIPVLRLLLDNIRTDGINNYFIFRMIMYLVLHLVSYDLTSHCGLFVTYYDKIREYNSEPAVWKIFTKKELSNLFIFSDVLKIKYDADSKK